MDAEAIIRAVKIALVVGLTPGALQLLLSYVFDEKDGPTPSARAASLATLPGLLVFGAALGGLTFGPPLAYAQRDPAALAAAIALALLVVAVTRPWRGVRPSLAPLPIAVGAVVGLLPVGILGAVVLMTELDAEPSSLEAEAQAERRVKVVPYDAKALVALAYGAARREALPRAEALRDAAERAGAEPVSLLELSAELAALGGDCDAARAAFEGALKARTAAAMEQVLERPLSLGTYTLPPTLVRLCGLEGGTEGSAGSAGGAADALSAP